MTRAQLADELFLLVGDRTTVTKIFHLFGKLSPEPGSGNLPDVPQYDQAKVRQVGRQKFHFTLEQQASAREVMRKMGMM